jgi:hypothetical protein
MAQGKLKVKTKVPGNSSKKNQPNKAGPSKIKKGNKVIAPKKQTQQVKIKLVRVAHPRLL